MAFVCDKIGGGGMTDRELEGRRRGVRKGELRRCGMPYDECVVCAIHHGSHTVTGGNLYLTNMPHTARPSSR